MQIPSGLACPKCHGALEAEQEQALRCPACRVRYPVVHGIPSFVEPASATPVPAACALSVVIPSLNEAPNLDRLLPGLERALRSLGISHEVLVVDGGSSDGSPEIARMHSARVVNQSLPGYGGALRAGFKESRGEYVLTLDADGSHDPRFLSELWAARGTAEVVVASRYVAGGAADMPAWRYLLSRILNLTFRLGLSLPVKDLSSGFRLYARSPLAQLDLRGTNFDVLEEILIRTLAAGYTVAEVPFRYEARLSGKSHASLIRFGISYLQTFLALWRLRNSIASADYDARAYDSLIPLQRYWQRRRHRVITALSRPFERILDVGCGSSRILAAKPEMVGLDIQLHKLRHARRFGNPLVHGSIFELPFADAAFDCVICSEVIEHIPADERPFDELARVLKPEGRLILGTPDYDRWSWRVLEWLYARLAPGGYADEHITHYGRTNLAAYLQGRGFTVERVHYVGASEMIFSLRKNPAAAPAMPLRPVTSALALRAA